MQQAVLNFLQQRYIRYSILAIIGFNAALLGIETSKTVMSSIGGVVTNLNKLCLSIFVLEMLLKLYAKRLSFFKSGWDIFDAIIIVSSLMPSSGSLSVLRALRLLRITRVISVTPSLRRVVEGFLTALPGMASVFLLMSLIFYISAVMATNLFAEQFPEWFGTVGASLYSLFQIMTLESWSMGIVRPVMEDYPLAWVFFVPFIAVTSFTVVNLLVGLIVNSMQEAHADESNAATQAYREEIIKRLTEIEKKIS